MDSTDASAYAANMDALYLGLLWDNELELLRPLLTIIVSNMQTVMDSAYDRCKTHFGDPRGVFRPDAFHSFAQSMLEALTALVDQNPHQHETMLLEAGRMLAERSVPFRDVILALSFYEESSFKILPPLATNNLQICQLFDKLNHIRLALLAQGYIQSAARLGNLDFESEEVASPVSASHAFHGIVGASSRMRELFERIKAASQVRSTMLLVGESGTGKELVARAIHQAGPDQERPFVAVNCAAIPKELVESELFGFERGAFSGAASPSLGLFRSADKGTLFLDEITEMSPGLQSKVLRAVQERTVRPLGSAREIPVDIRLVASTNRDPNEAVKAGALRVDLYYRLQANVLRLPPLRERFEDIPLLARHFMSVLGAKISRREPATDIAPEALELMKSYRWPGNVRELSNAIETALTFGKGPIIRVEDLPDTLSDPRRRAQAQTPEQPAQTAKPNSQKPISSEHAMTLSEGERQLLIRALAIAGNNKSRAAGLLQISRRRLYFLIRKYGL